MNKNMKLELTSKQVEVLEIALTEMFNSDSWTWGVNADDVDVIADRAEYILKMLERRVKTKMKIERIFFS